MSSIEYINSVIILDSVTTSISFNEIPQTYQDICIEFVAGQTANSGIYIRLNEDSGTNYSRTALFGNGSSVSSARASNTSQAWVIAANIAIQNNLTDSGNINIFNYSSNNIYKTILQSEGCASTGVTNNVLLWRSTNSINKIELINASTDKFTQGSTFTLWGVK